MLLNKLRDNKTIFFTIFSFSSLLYLLTLHGSFNGYEGETAQAAINLLHGKYEIKRAGLGAVLMYLPFILLEKILPLVKLTMVPAFYSALTISLIYSISQKITSRIDLALLVSCLIATGSMVWPYSAFGMEYQAMFLITLLLYSLVVWQQKSINPIIIGLILAWLSISKSYGCLLFLPVAAFIYITLKKSGQLALLKQIKFILPLILPTTILFSLNLLINYLYYNNLSGVYSLSHEFQIQTWWEGFYGFFFSVGKNIFAYNPLLILAILSWPKFYQKHKALAVYIIFTLLSLLLLNAPFAYWTDETWGPRKLMPIIPLLHLSLLIFFEVRNKKMSLKIMTACLIIAAIYTQIIGVSFKVGRNLAVIRELNKDSLSTMRYIPQLSHQVINHQLLASYLHRQLTGQSKTFSYAEMSWFRWTVGQNDRQLSQGKVNLKKYDQIDIYWLNQPDLLKKIIFTCLFLSFAINSWWLLNVHKKLDK